MTTTNITHKIHPRARRAYEVVVRIDQGDYLDVRGTHDWGRADYGDVTAFSSVAQAQATIDRLGLQGLAREIEPTQNC